MKRALVAAGTLAAFSLAPLTAAACDAYDEAMATAAPPAALASTQPAASKVPVAVAKTPAKVTKQVAIKTDAKLTDTKVAAAAGN